MLTGALIKLESVWIIETPDNWGLDNYSFRGWIFRYCASTFICRSLFFERLELRWSGRPPKLPLILQVGHFYVHNTDVVREWQKTVCIFDIMFQPHAVVTALWETNWLILNSHKLVNSWHRTLILAPTAVTSVHIIILFTYILLCTLHNAQVCESSKVNEDGA